SPSPPNAKHHTRASFPRVVWMLKLGARSCPPLVNIVDRTPPTLVSRFARPYVGHIGGNRVQLICREPRVPSFLPFFGFTFQTRLQALHDHTGFHSWQQCRLDERGKPIVEGFWGEFDQPDGIVA